MATDWTRAMGQSIRYFRVDPDTMRDVAELTQVNGCTINRDSESDTLTSGSFSVDGDLPDAETWVRVYLYATQDGATEHVAVDTVLAQAPTSPDDGTPNARSADAYGPALELRDDSPHFGWCAQGSAQAAARAIASHGHAPVVGALEGDLPAPIVAGEQDSWMTMLDATLAAMGHVRDVDAFGRHLMRPVSDVAALMPSWTFRDDGRSIILGVAVDRDVYQVHNVCEVVRTDETGTVVGTAINDDPASETSTVRLGRRKLLRVVNPDELPPGSSQEQADALAERLLREDSVITTTYKLRHGYCPPRPGHCVALRYRRREIDDVGLVVAQKVQCSTGVVVESHIRSTRSTWR